MPVRLKLKEAFHQPARMLGYRDQTADRDYVRARSEIGRAPDRSALGMGCRLVKLRTIASPVLIPARVSMGVPEQRAGSEIFFGARASRGFSIALDIQRDGIFHCPGRFDWTSGFGVSAYTDPAGRNDRDPNSRSG
jgi:hypothetical protein